MSHGFKHIATGTTLGVSNPIIIAFVIYVLFCYFINHMQDRAQDLRRRLQPRGRGHFGHPAAEVLWLVYAVMGALAGLAGVIWVAKFASAQGDTATGYELNVIAAAVLGGVSISGGSGKVSGLILGHDPPGHPQQRAAPHQYLPVLAAGHPGDRDPRRRPYQRAGQEEQPAVRAPKARDLGARWWNDPFGSNRPWSWRTFFLQWEWLLVLIFMAVNIVNSTLSPYYLNADTFLQTPMSFLDMAFLVLPMTMVIILGNIDISVGSTVALSAVIMAVAYNAGLPMPLAVILCLCVASACGLINGILMTRFKELSSVIVTLATMIIYRGIAYVILQDQASGQVPEVVLLPRLGLGRQGAHHPHRLRDLRRRFRPPSAQDELRAQNLRHGEQPHRLPLFRESRQTPSS